MNIQQGTKIRFGDERNPYTVRAIGKRYAVCTKPFALKKTVLYTVVDLEKEIRGTENLIFGMGAETDERCEQMLNRLESGETEVSHRNFVDLWVTHIDGQKLDV